MRPPRLIAALGVALAVIAVGSPDLALLDATPVAPSMVLTSPDDASVRLSSQQPQTDQDSTDAEIVVDTSKPAQTWIGEGAALTDGSVLQLQQHPELLPLLFGQDDSSLGLDWVRLPLSATDMSTSLWAWRATRHGARPTAPARAPLRLLRRSILPLSPGLRVVASAWTAPPSYKSPAGWFGGQLRADRVTAYADFLVGQARWLRNHGVPLAAITLGNEPGHSGDYPTMTIGDDELAQLARLVGPRLDALGIDLWGLDHNWSDVGRLQSTGTEALDAVALHCYHGTPSQAAGLSLPWLVTECTGTDDTAAGTFAWDSRNVVADAIAAGSTGLMMWNLALSPGWRGAYGGCGNCRGLVTVDGGSVTREPEFYTLAHLSRAAPPGSLVVPTSTNGPFLTAGFRYGDRVGVYGYNDSDRTLSVLVHTADGSVSSLHMVGPHEIFSWTGSPQ